MNACTQRGVRTARSPLRPAAASITTRQIARACLAVRAAVERPTVRPVQAPAAPPNVYSGIRNEEPPALQRRRENTKQGYEGSLGYIARGSVVAVVLGGGENDSRRLFPLTERRTLPAIPIGGCYRLIDIPLSNLLASGINRVYVLTQWNSTSLNRYIQRTYDAGSTGSAYQDGFVEVVAATQGPVSQRWAEGAADNVRQWWDLFSSSFKNKQQLDDVLILPSDQVYRMDFAYVLDYHRFKKADLTIVCRPVSERLVGTVGCMKLDPRSQVLAFEEKPQGHRKALMSMDYDSLMDFFTEEHLQSVPFTGDESARAWIGSTGIYVFRKEALDTLLKDNPTAKDFSHDLIPKALRSGMKVMAFHHPDYWSDIGGSIGDFFDFNIALANEEVPFSFEGQHAPFYGNSLASLPPNLYEGARLRNTVLGSGCRLGPSSITSSVIGCRTIIRGGCDIQDTLIMGADYYEEEKDWKREVGPSFPHMGIGENCTIRRAIVDKNARVGANVQLVNKEGIHESMDRLGQGIAIRDRVIVVTKSAVLPDGTLV